MPLCRARTQKKVSSDAREPIARRIKHSPSNEGNKLLTKA